MEQNNLMPVIIKGKLGNVEFDSEGEALYLDYNAIQFLFENGVNFKLDNQFENVTNVTSQVACLFALSKNVEAWELINEKYEEIDFLVLMQTPYFQLDRQATKVYKYEYEQGIFDDDTYAYFNVVSGSFFDEDFMYKYLGTCMTRKEILEKLYGAYNGYQATEIGLIEYTDAIRSLLEACTEEPEDISEYIVGPLQTIEFTSENIIDFLNKGYIANSHYIAVAMRAIFERTQYVDGEENFMTPAWEYFYSNENYIENMKKVRLDNLQYAESFIEYLVANKKTELFDTNVTDAIACALLNSPAFYWYMNTIMLKFKSITLPYMINSIKSVFVDEIDPSLYENSYIIENLSNMDDFKNKFIRSPYYIPWRLIYNAKNHKLYSGRWTSRGHVYQTYDEDEIENALSWILYDTEMNDDAYNTFNSKEEYEEARLALRATASNIVMVNNSK